MISRKLLFAVYCHVPYDVRVNMKHLIIPHIPLKCESLNFNEIIRMFFVVEKHNNLVL